MKIHLLASVALFMSFAANAGTKYVFPATGFGRRLAASALRIQPIVEEEDQVRAKSGNTVGHCLEAVDRSIGHVFGWSTTPFIPLYTNNEPTSAGDVAHYLAMETKFFTEEQVTPKQLSLLPPGSVVVWGKSSEDAYGHISISSGDGREISDHIYQQMPIFHGLENYRVFIPRNI